MRILLIVKSVLDQVMFPAVRQLAIIYTNADWVQLTDWPLKDVASIPSPYWLEVNIGADNGLLPSGIKPLPETMLTQI